MSLKFAEVEERYPLQISNAWTGTKLIINEDVPEIIDFIKSLPADNTYATQNQLLPSSSQSFSAQSSAAGSQMSPEGRFIQGHRVLKQIDIIRLNKDEIVITVVTTSHLRPLAEDGTFLDAVAVLNKLLAKHRHINAKSQNTKLKFLYSG
ncbi:hypothetical protein P8452_03257 [Trifolium repens]|nr:hypothetical protein P8452_03257 [Trifolium repens]